MFAETLMRIIIQSHTHKGDTYRNILAFMYTDVRYFIPRYLHIAATRRLLHNNKWERSYSTEGRSLKKKCFFVMLLYFLSITESPNSLIMKPRSNVGSVVQDKENILAILFFLQQTGSSRGNRRERDF